MDEELKKDEPIIEESETLKALREYFSSAMAMKDSSLVFKEGSPLVVSEKVN